MAKPELERKAEQRILSQPLMGEKPIYPIPNCTGGSDIGTSRAFPPGKRLRKIEHELPTAHAPKNGSALHFVGVITLIMVVDWVLNLAIARVGK